MLGRIETPSLYFSRIGNTGSRRRFSFVPDGRSRPSWTQLQCLVANEQSPGLLSLQLRSPRFSNYGCQPGPRQILSDFEVLTTVRTSSEKTDRTGLEIRKSFAAKGLRMSSAESIVTKRVALAELFTSSEHPRLRSLGTSRGFQSPAFFVIRPFSRFRFFAL